MSTDPSHGRQAPPWQTFLSGSGFTGPSRGQVPPEQMRISDAERQQVADVLSKHFADGRLDRNEFDERVSAAMAAKVRGDLRGLLDDLPSSVPAGSGATGLVPPPAHRHRHHLLLYVLLAFLLMTTVGSWFAPWHVPWLLLFVVVLIAVRGPRRWHVHHRHQHWNHPHPHDIV